ncbi:MAG: LysR family transcriptional regulator [Clostridia bacterium]|nr:LysR family transcriptional regulator [Clostridia bacterium]
MDIRTLRYFLAVAQEESISKAADVLHMTQPPLSRQLKALEEELETALFTRGSRKVTLTRDGEILCKWASQIVRLMDHAKEELSASKGEISGDIWIGAAESASVRHMLKAAKKMQQLHPHIRFHIFSGNAQAVLSELDRGLLDFGVLVAPANIDNYNYIQLPTRDTWGVLMLKSSALAAKSTVSPKDLWELPLIVSRQSLEQNDISGWIRRDLTELRIAGTYNLLFNAALMVEAGLGYAICLDKLIGAGEESPLCFRPLAPVLEAGLYIVWKKHYVLSGAAERFLTTLNEQCEKDLETPE